MKLLVLSLFLSSCWSQQGPPRELLWDYSEWQPILAPCSTCRVPRILEAKPAQVTNIRFKKNEAPAEHPVPISTDTSSVVQLQPIIQTKLTKPLKTNLFKAPLVPTQPPRSLAATFPPNPVSDSQLTPGVTSDRGGEVHLVYLPEGSIQQLSSANAARIVPTSQVPNHIQSGIEAGPPPPSPETIQAIDFSDKQKRDHQGHIVSGGASNALPMSLITTRGHENDAIEKLRLLETALASPIEQEEDGKLPRVFIAPSHVPPPPGYVKIPLIPQGKPNSHEIAENGPLPSTFLTPDTRNPPPGFVKFDLPSAVSHLSKDIPVVVPNSQVGPNLIFDGPAFASTPGPLRPDASLNFQTENVRTGKTIGPNSSPVQVISKGEPKPFITNKSPAAPTQAVTKLNPEEFLQNSPQFPPRPILQQANPSIPQPIFPQSQIPPVPQQFRPNSNQPLGQPAFPVFPGQAVQPGQHFLQPGQPFRQEVQTFQRPGHTLPQHIPQQNFDQRFIHQNQTFPRPPQIFQNSNRPLPQLNQPVLPNQPSIQPFFQPGQTVVQFGQNFPQSGLPFPPREQSVQRPVDSNPNHSIFRSPHAQVQPDFPAISIPSPSQPVTDNIKLSQPTTPQPPFSPTFPSTLSPLVTTPRSASSTVSQFPPRAHSFTQFGLNQFSQSTPRPTPFIQFSPSPDPVAQRPRLTTPAPVSLIPESSSFSPPSIPQLTPRPVAVSTTTPSQLRPIVTSSQSSEFFSPSGPIVTSPQPILSSTPRPKLLTFTPQPLSETTLQFASTPSSLSHHRPDFEESQDALEHQTSEVHEPSIPSFQRPQFPQIPSFQEPRFPQTQSNRPALAPEIPSFQRPQNPTLSRLPGAQTPRIPTFQRSTTSRTPFNEEPQEIEEPGKRQRLPIFPRFQSPRITTIDPEEEEQTEFPEITTTEFSAPVPSSHSQTTPSPVTTTTVKVTTFKPKFDFNLGNRRPIIRRKLRPTETAKKDAGEKKTEASTLFPPFSVARTLNPQNTENKENVENTSQGQASVTVPPSGVFGRRLRPRTKAPSSPSEDDSNPDPTKPSGVRSRGLVGNRARELPDWLKERRQVRGRFRGQSPTTEKINVVDSVLENDAPLDILENNEFTGAESIQVVISSPPENSVASPLSQQESGKTQESKIQDTGAINLGQAYQTVGNVSEEQAVNFAVAEDIQKEVTNKQDSVSSSEANTSQETSTESTEGLTESYEDYSFEKTEALPEPEPEPSNKYVAEFEDQFEDDSEDKPETYPIPDRPQTQPPSFPNPHSVHSEVIHTSAHSYPYAEAPFNPLIENSNLNSLETTVDHPVEVGEVHDAAERYVGNLSSDENELKTDHSFDYETDEQLPNDTGVNYEGDSEAVTESANISHELNYSEFDNDTHHLGGEGEEDAVGEKGESQELREDSYQEYNTESPENLSLIPTDYFTALSPGQLQDYDYYEYDIYVDKDNTKGLDQDFGGSSAQVVFAVPVTEYYPEETTSLNDNFENTEVEEKSTLEQSDRAETTTEETLILPTEEFGLEIEDEYLTTVLPDIQENEPVTDNLADLNDNTTDAYDFTTQLPEENGLTTAVSTDLSLTTSTTTLPPQTNTPIILTTTSTTIKPASKRPLYERLQNIGKKSVELADKNLVRVPKILGQSTVAEIRSSDPIICFRNSRCFRARGQRKRRSNRP